MRLWNDLMAFRRVLRLRGMAREAWRMVTTSLTRPGSFEGAEGVEVGAQVFSPGSKWMSASWCLPCSENRGRLANSSTITGSRASTVTWQFDASSDYGITRMER